MSHMTLGITATELFACNPYRILGTAVDTPTAEISNLYKKLLDKAANETTDTYHTAYDFDSSLPPFTRSTSDLKTAYAKLASNGYRCFAYSSEVFSASLNIDDIMLNLRDITCYDCFLRCYMWLVTNDREFEEPELWVPLCQYIDEMIMSSPEKWSKYFDHRFPAEMLDSTQTAYRSFYTTFCDIILLPIKELVRGSMKCKTAMDILRAAKVDVDEEFEFVEIPQANLPKNGEKAPLLKIAVKDGEQYFDVNAGKMISFESEADSAVESNSFTAAASAITADAITSTDEPETDVIPPEPEENPVCPEVILEPAESKPAKSKPVQSVAKEHAPEPAKQVSKPKKNIASAPVPQVDFTAKPAAPTVTKPKAAVKPEPVDDIADSDDDNVILMPKKRQRVSPASSKSAPSAPKTTVSSLNSPVPQVQLTSEAPAKQTKTVTKPADAKADTPFISNRGKKGLSSLIDAADDFEEELEEQTSEESNEDEASLYTDYLIKMLRANRSGAQMKTVDTRHVFDNGDSLGTSQESNLSMDDINMKRYDNKLLESSFDAIKAAENSSPREVMEQKYKNISINDMLNPTLGSKMNSGFKEDAIDTYKRKKANEKKANMTVLKFMLVLMLILVVVLLLMMFGII